MKCLATHIALVIVFGLAACQSQQTIGQLDTSGLGSDLDSDTSGGNHVSPQGCVYRYKIVDLGTLNASYSSAHGLNNDGEVVGHISDENGSPQAFIWRPTKVNGTVGTMSELGEESLYPETRAEAINDSGEVAGWGFEIEGGSTKTNRALFWSADEEEYYVASGHKATNVAISNNGLVGGNRWPLPSAGVDYASGFTWNSAALFEEDTSSEEPFVDIVELGRLPGASGWQGTSIRDINDAGVAVGSGYSALYLSRPFKWTPSTQFTYLGTLSSTIDDASIPYAINNKGKIVGSSLLIVGDDVRLSHPVLWSPFSDASEPPTDLGILPSPSELNQGQALDINDDGVIVGYDEGTLSSTAIQRAWAYCGKVKRNLNDLLKPEDRAQWTLHQAHGINDYGSIVGQGAFGGIAPRAFLLVPDPIVR